MTAPQALRARFEAKPEDGVAFAALEEALFVAGEWRELVGLYERRLTALDLTPERAPKLRARVVLRLAQALEERCGDASGAAIRYREAITLDPTLRVAFAQLRKLATQREDWDAVLTLADAEAKLPMRPSEKAQLASELGTLWFEKRRDAAQARTHFERALEAEASYAPALLGLAAVAEASGAYADAAAALERATQSLRGPERAAAYSRLAKLQERQLGDGKRATESYRRALSDDPRQSVALVAMAERAEANQQWAAFDELEDRLFALTKGRLERLAIAHDAGRVQLEKANNPQGARMWFKRALELFPGDPVVHLYLADVERLAGNQTELAFHLRRATELADNAAPVEALRESAQLETARGEESLAAAQLRRALERDPRRSDVASELAEALTRSGRDDEFVDLIEAQLAERPGGAREAALWIRLGAFHEERRDDLATALGAYGQALDGLPADPAALAAFERAARKLEQLDALQARLTAAALASPESERAGIWLRLADLKLEHFQDHPGAREAYEAALTADPGATRAQQGLERIALATGDHASILTSFEREAEVTPERERLAFLVGELARIYEERGEPARALHWLLRLAAQRPEDTAALTRVARLQATLRDSAGEASTLEKLDALLSGEAQLAGRRRLAAQCDELGDAVAALRAHRAVLAADPTDLASARAQVTLSSPNTQLEEHVAALRQLIAIASGDERVAREYDLGCLLMDRAGDLRGAGACFEAVIDAPNAPADVEGRFTEILSQLGHWDVVCARLDLRRRLLDPLDPRGFDLDLARAEILADRLERASDAIALCESVRKTNPQNGRARDVLERALRKCGDDRRLAALLAERGELEADRERKALLDMERALLFEQRLRSLPEARAVLAEIAASGSGMALDAERKLRQILENESDWPALVERLNAALGRGDAAADAKLHRELAALLRDRLGDGERAIRHLEAALALTPGDLPLLHALQASFEHLGRRADLCAAFERELAASGDAGERAGLLHARCAELCESAGDDERAEQHHAAVLALDPTAAHSAQFVADRYERAGRVPELLALLRQRLALTSDEAEAGPALRLRIATLEADALGDAEAAIATLLPASQRDPLLGLVAEPLANLYRRTGRNAELVALAERASGLAANAFERSAWNLRRGDAEVARGELEAAAEAYRRALTDRPADADLQGALRDLYRRLGRAEPLARLLQAELSRTNGPLEVPLRLELANLLSSALDDPASALVQYRRVLELEPHSSDALERAVAAAERTSAHAECAELLARAAARASDPARRARLLARRGALLAGPLAEPDAAIACYESALALAPDAADTLAALRGVLEDRADWPRALDCFERELAALAPDALGARTAVIEEGARFANEMLGSEAALPWLERLHAARPGDADPLVRIAAVHRVAGRADALLRTLEAELALSPGPARRIELALESAQLLCERLRAPARAAVVLEEARAAEALNPQLLAALDPIYAALGRSRDRLDVVLARIEIAPAAARLPLRKTAASLARALGERSASAEQLWAALAECGPIAHERAELLRSLAEDLRDRPDLWVRVSEAELAALDPAAPVFVERRHALRAQLAETYAARLAQPEQAIAHLALLLDGDLRGDDARTRGERERAGELLIAELRRMGDPVGLERRLGAQLAGFPARHAAPWLELGRLRIEALHRPGPAADAFEAALRCDANALPALRGLRAACELLGRWQEVASTLERELAMRLDASASERAALFRRLGEISWRRLDETTRASRAYASALEAVADDLASLRALQQLFEAMEDWRGAIDLYESEVAVLGEAAEPLRRRSCWLRAAEIAAQHTQEAPRALRCYDAAARIAALESPRLAELAEVLARLGERERFVETYAAWIDAPDSHAGADAELRLASALEELERLGDAQARAERAAGKAPNQPETWDRVAQLRERLGQRDGAADAFARAAELHGGAQAAERRIRAADLLAERDPERSCALLERAAQDEPLSAGAFARLALAARAAGDVARSEQAAERTIAVASESAPIAPALRRDAALAGARSALALDHLTAAARLLADVLSLEPDHAEALGQQGRTLLRLGDVAGARRALTRALELASEPRDRAVMLALLGGAEAAGRATELALNHYAEALALDAGLEEAHAGLVQLLMREQREEAAIAALLAWASHAAAPSDRAQRLLQAAEIELSRPGREAAAEGLLRDAARTDASLADVWALLAELLAKQGRWAELIDAAMAGAAATGDAAVRSRLDALRARALEQRGDLREAADAFAAAARASARASEAALSAARLLRGLGEWQAAAEVLRSFTERSPEDARSARATALHQLGRLLAGPLEDVDGAVEVYRQAAALDPDRRECREALADLLLHRPRYWDEAITRHRELLAEDPTRIASLRGLLRIARGRGNASAASAGLVLLRALGAATAEEAREAPARLPFAIAARPALANPSFELARRLAQEASSELAEALGGAQGTAEPLELRDPSARFRAAVTAAEAELSAPALVPLTTPDLGSALVLLAELGAELETVSADGALVNALSQALGWRAKKRMRRALDGHTPDEVAAIDFAAWRSALRALASAVVVDRGECNLREAFVAWLQADDPEGARTFAPEADLRARIHAHTEARALLRHAIDAWLTGL